MKTKNFFFKFLSISTIMLFFVSCTSNEETPTSSNTQNASRNSNQALSTNIPHGKLIIINNTTHEFIGYLFAFDNPNLFDLDDYRLWQNIRIDANSNNVIGNYYDTHVLGIDICDGGTYNDKWYEQNDTTNSLSSVNGIDASVASGTSGSHMHNFSSNDYVQWLGMDNVSATDGLVKLRFKLDYTTGDIDVYGPQEYTDAGSVVHTFTTTGSVSSTGTTTITLDETP